MSTATCSISRLNVVETLPAQLTLLTVSIRNIPVYYQEPNTESIAWQDVSIVLNQPDMSFKHNGAWAFGATGGAMSTPDEGKTWNFTTLNVPAQKAR